MTAEELLSEVAARGVSVVADGGDLWIRPGSRPTPELFERLRAHEPELPDLLAWPEECLAAEREFGHPYGRLFPLVGKTLRTRQAAVACSPCYRNGLWWSPWGVRGLSPR